MAWQLIEQTETRGPRALTRSDRTRRRLADGRYLDAEEPSVGGEAVSKHSIYRCDVCHALAVTDGSKPGAACNPHIKRERR